MGVILLFLFPLFDRHMSGRAMLYIDLVHFLFLYCFLLTRLHRKKNTLNIKNETALTNYGQGKPLPPYFDNIGWLGFIVAVKMPYFKLYYRKSTWIVFECFLLILKRLHNWPSWKMIYIYCMLKLLYPWLYILNVIFG